VFVTRDVAALSVQLTGRPTLKLSDLADLKLTRAADGVFECSQCDTRLTVIGARQTVDLDFLVLLYVSCIEVVVDRSVSVQLLCCRRLRVVD